MEVQTAIEAKTIEGIIEKVRPLINKRSRYFYTEKYIPTCLEDEDTILAEHTVDGVEIIMRIVE